MDVINPLRSVETTIVVRVETTKGSYIGVVRYITLKKCLTIKTKLFDKRQTALFAANIIASSVASEEIEMQEAS